MKIVKFVTEIERDIINRISVDEIANKYSINRATVYLHFRSLIKSIRVKENQILEEEIINLHNQKFNILEIAKRTGKSFYYIKSVLTKNNKKVIKTNTYNQKYTCNQDYFDVIDNERKAYFLGLIYADGCVSIRKIKNKPNTFTYVMRICLKKTDDYLLKELSLDIFGMDLVKYYKYKGKKSKYEDSASLCVYNKYLCESLIRIGCVPRKSLILELPQQQVIPEQFFHHFIRGYFDGDGTVGAYKDRTKRVYNKILSYGFCGSKNFMVGLKEFFLKKFGIHSSLVEDKITTFSTLSIAAQPSIKVLFSYMYNNASIFMLRKHDRFINHYASL
jgi:hypothetical protein